MDVWNYKGTVDRGVFSMLLLTNLNCSHCFSKKPLKIAPSDHVSAWAAHKSLKKVSILFIYVILTLILKQIKLAVCFMILYTMQMPREFLTSIILNNIFSCCISQTACRFLIKKNVSGGFWLEFNQEILK